MARVKAIEKANRSKFAMASAAMATGKIKLATGEEVEHIPSIDLMTVAEGDRMLHYWSNCGDVSNSSGWLESFVARKCGKTSEHRWWCLYDCDKKEAKHDLEPANCGVDTGEGHVWVFAAAERLAVEGAGPQAAAATMLAQERAVASTLAAARGNRS